MRKQILGKHEWLLLFAAVGFNILIYNGGRLLTRGRPHVCLATPIDDHIPFLAWTIVIYWGCYLFWAVNYILSVRSDRQAAYRFILAHILAESVCFVTFFLLPTTMTRAEVTGDSLAELAVLATYRIDDADNLLPSIHCLVSWLSWIGVRRDSKIPAWYRWLSLAFAIAVCICTLTVKQHVLPDTIAGILLAELSYAAAGAFQKRYKKRGTDHEHTGHSDR